MKGSGDLNAPQTNAEVYIVDSPDQTCNSSNTQPINQEVGIRKDWSRPPKPLAYYGILGVQTIPSRQVKKPTKKIRPPSAPATFQRSLNSHPKGLKINAASQRSVRKRHSNPEGNIINSNIRVATDPSTETPDPRVRPKSATNNQPLPGQPASYFDLHLNQTQSTYKVGVPSVLFIESLVLGLASAGF